MDHDHEAEAAARVNSESTLFDLDDENETAEDQLDIERETHMENDIDDAVSVADPNRPNSVAHADVEGEPEPGDQDTPSRKRQRDALEQGEFDDGPPPQRRRLDTQSSYISDPRSQAGAALTSLEGSGPPAHEPGFSQALHPEPGTAEASLPEEALEPSVELADASHGAADPARAASATHEEPWIEPSAIADPDLLRPDSFGSILPQEAIEDSVQLADPTAGTVDHERTETTPNLHVQADADRQNDPVGTTDLVPPQSLEETPMNDASDSLSPEPATEKVEIKQEPVEPVFNATDLRPVNAAGDVHVETEGVPPKLDVKMEDVGLAGRADEIKPPLKETIREDDSKMTRAFYSGASELVALIRDNNVNTVDGSVEYLTAADYARKYPKLPLEKARGDKDTLIKGRDGSIVTQEQYLHRGLNSPDKVRGMSPEEIVRGDFAQMGLNPDAVPRDEKLENEHVIMVRTTNGTYHTFDPTKSEKSPKSLKAAEQEFAEVWVKTKNGAFKTPEALGWNTAATLYAAAAGVPFAERRSDLQVALYRVGKKGKEYVSHEEYEHLRNAEEPPIGMRRNKSNREVLLQSPDGQFHSPADYQKSHVTTYLATMKAEGLDPSMGNKPLERDNTRPQTLVAVDGKLVDGAKLSRRLGRSVPLVKEFGEENVFLQRVTPMGRQTGSFQDIDKAKDVAAREGTSMRTQTRLKNLGVTAAPPCSNGAVSATANKKIQRLQNGTSTGPNNPTKKAKGSYAVSNGSGGPKSYGNRNDVKTRAYKYEPRGRATLGR